MKTVIKRNVTKLRFINNSLIMTRTAATSKMERFVIIVNGFQLLTIITKPSILDVAAVLDPSLKTKYIKNNKKR